jgi:hypothetical protein
MLFSACATINTGADYDAGVTLDRFKTFNWGGGDTLPVGDPRLDNNPFFDARVRAAVQLELAARRLRRTDFRSAGVMSDSHCNQRHSEFRMRFSISRLKSPPCGRSLPPQFAAALGIGTARPDLVVRFGRGPALPRSMRRPVTSVLV